LTQQELLALAEKQRLGTATKEEQYLLHTFVDKLQQLDLKANPSDQNRLRILKDIEARIKTESKPGLNYKRLLTYAAIFIGLLSIASLSTYVFGTQLITEQTGKGEKRTLALADGSSIILNANSKIIYSEDFTQNRRIELQGEAYFEVHRDTLHPFTITTGPVQTQVLGTTFNINSYEADEVTVSVNSGKVAVHHTKTDEKVYLTKNQQVLFNALDAPVQAQVNSEDQMAWTKNIIALNNTTLIKTAGILENWYDVKIEFEDTSIEGLRITGKFKEEPLETVLQSIALINNLKIDTLTQKHFVIRKKHYNPLKNPSLL